VSRREPDAARLQALCDREDITAILHRFCRGIDRGDEELLVSCFHPGAFDDHGAVSGDAAEVMAAIIVGVRGYWDVTWHAVSNCSIDLDGDVAHVESYLFSVNQRAGSNGKVTAVFAGRYVDRFEHRDDRWAISHRVVVHDWSFADKLGDYRGDMSVYVTGTRDRSDASYAR
jgi:hypothetical protein